MERVYLWMGAGVVLGLGAVVLKGWLNAPLVTPFGEKLKAEDPEVKPTAHYSSFFILLSGPRRSSASS